MNFVGSSEPNNTGFVGAVVPDGNRTVNFWVVTAVVTAVAVASETLLAVELEETALFVFVVAAPALALATRDVVDVAAKEPAVSLDTCAATGDTGSMPPFFLAPGPQIAVAMTPAVAKNAAIVIGQRDFFLGSLKFQHPSNNRSPNQFESASMACILSTTG